MSTRPTSNDGVRPGYAEALAELEGILADLERDNVDVDRLAGQVQRAAELIRLCRERIGNARMQIEHVVAELGADEAGNAGSRA